MIKEIKYTGFTATPSDYECPDGELDAAINLVPEEGELHPVQEGEVVFSLEGYDVQNVYIHQNKYKHYIIVHKDGGVLKLSWRDEEGSVVEDIDSVEFESGEEFVDYSSIGNTIIITTNEKFYYFIWRDNGYSFLGNNIPHIKMAFALDGEVVNKTFTATDITYSSDGGETEEMQWKTEYGDTLTFPIASGYDYTDWQELEWPLSSQYEYRISNATSNSDPRFYYYIQGWNGSEWKKILGHYGQASGGAVTRRTENGYTPKISENFSKIRVCLYNARSSVVEPTYQLPLVIEKGEEKSAAITVIEKTKENLDALLAKIQLFQKTFVTEKERFMYPFFVRYAVRMYDQTYGYISTPILMLPNTGCVPMLDYKFFEPAVQNNQINAYAFVADLQYAFLNNIDGNWEDIIDGIDIFLSQPIYTYDQDPKIDADYSDTSLFVYKTLQWEAIPQTSPAEYEITINEIEDIDYGNLRLSDGAVITEGYYEKNLYFTLRDNLDYGNPQTRRQWNVVQIAPYSQEKIREKVEGVSNYYLVHSFDLKDIPTSGTPTIFKTLEIKDGTLYSEGFVNRMSLDENMLTYRTPKTGNLFTYNNRLHSYNTTFKLPSPTPLELQNGMHYPSDEYSPDNNNKVYVYIKTTQGEKIVEETYDEFGEGSCPWFFYPDSRAYKAQFFEGNDGLVYELPLKPHDKLSGAYWINDTLFCDGTWYDEHDAQEPTIDDSSDKINESNVIYVSGAENPFVFIDSLAVQVGCNVILGLSSATKALSQGQFGQFPLYAFTDTGVWALETSNTGTYIARQPVTRDVCTNADSITQLDDAVIFSTSRGIMLLSGSDTVCITDSIFSDSEFSIIDTDGDGDLLPQIERLANSYPVIGVAADIVPFRTFLPGARMMYDYTHQRIIVYNPNKDYAYIYSLKSKRWGMMESTIKYGINSYPECLAVDSSNKIINLSSMDTNDTKNCLLISRPLKMDAPDVLKTIDTIIQRGQFRKGDANNASHVKSILYGSRDLFHWHLVYSSQDHYLRGFRGTPYKYFRIALLCELKKDESLFGCTIQYTPRLTDQPR